MMVSLPIDAEPVPFYVMENGGARLNGCRVALEGVVIMYQQGHSAEEIHENLPTAGLAEIHASIAYYLRHQAEVQGYIDEIERETEQVMAKAESQPRYQETKARIKARWAERQASGTTPR